MINAKMEVIVHDAEAMQINREIPSKEVQAIN